MNRIKKLDAILNHLDQIENYVSIELLQNKFREEWEVQSNIVEYLEFLLLKDLIIQNGTKDKIKISVAGSVKISKGGFKREVRREIYDTRLKWFFWVLSAIISLVALGLSIISFSLTN